MKTPWVQWLPGVLGRKQIQQLSDEYLLLAEPGKAIADAIDHSAIDLHLTDEAYELTGGSVKPSGTPYPQTVMDLGMCKRLDAVGGVFRLEPKHTYLFKLHERFLNLRQTPIFGQATAKSSVGRMDVLVRLIVDGARGYEGFRPDDLQEGTGDMFVEVTPFTFPVLVRPGISLNQVRLFYGDPNDCQIPQRYIGAWLLGGGGDRAADSISVDLSATTIGGLDASAFALSEESLSRDEPVALWTDSTTPRPDPTQYWQLQVHDKNKRLRIKPGTFYILRSKERLALPGGVAIYCRATDETIGEMRIHYAGFVHPLFGSKRTDGLKGTPLIFELRGHDVDLSLGDGERMAHLTFYRMSEEATGDPGSYGSQELQLSKFFDKWPDRLHRMNEAGNVERNN